MYDLCCVHVDVVYLAYIYTLQFVLDDGTGSLSAGLWREEAVSTRLLRELN